MDEKKLLEGKFSPNNKLSLFFVVLGCLALIYDTILVRGDIQFIIEDAFQEGLFEMWVVIFAFCCFVAAIVVYFMMRNCKIVITDKRIYGCSTFGKRITLPLDKISTVSTNPFGYLTVATSSGKINFWLITNGEEVWELINSLITNRQK